MTSAHDAAQVASNLDPTVSAPCKQLNRFRDGSRISMQTSTSAERMSEAIAVSEALAGKGMRKLRAAV